MTPFSNGLRRGLHSDAPPWPRRPTSLPTRGTRKTCGAADHPEQFLDGPAPRGRQVTHADIPRQREHEPGQRRPPVGGVLVADDGHPARRHVRLVVGLVRRLLIDRLRQSAVSHADRLHQHDDHAVEEPGPDAAGQQRRPAPADEPDRAAPVFRPAPD